MILVKWEKFCAFLPTDTLTLAILKMKNSVPNHIAVHFLSMTAYWQSKWRSDGVNQETANPKEVESTGLKVAFIYGDSVNTKYRFLMDAQDELEKEQNVIEERINRKLQKAEKRAMELQKQAPTMTQMQGQGAVRAKTGHEVDEQGWLRISEESGLQVNHYRS